MMMGGHGSFQQSYSGFNDFGGQQQQVPQQAQQQPMHQPNHHQPPGPRQGFQPAPQQPQGPPMGGPQLPGQFAMFQQPIVQDMALQYGQRLADQGKEQLEKYIPITRLKYYFAVDNKYVINKIRLLFFPFTHRDWSLKYDQDNPVQPRYDINAPDLYIPCMAYITYVVLAGLVLGMQDRFSPEQLGIQASSALAYAIMELIVYSLTLYIGNIQTMLKTLDLMAFAGYKFVIINVCLAVSILFRSSGYYMCLLYSSITLGFFLLRTIKAKVLSDAAPPAQQQQQPTGYDMYGQPMGGAQYDHRTGHKRKVYFLLLISGLQPFLCFWLSYHLMPAKV